MKDFRLSWVVPLSIIATSGCGWVDSSGRQENQSPGLTELTHIVIEDRDSVSLGVADPDRNLDEVDYELIAEGGELSAECVAAGGVLSGVDTSDFADSLEEACDAAVDQECGLTLEPELLSSELWASEIPKLRRPVALQYRLNMEDQDGAAIEQELTLCIASESTAPVAEDDSFDVEYDEERLVKGVGFDGYCNMTIETDVLGEFVPGVSGVLGNDTDDFDYSEDDANAQQCLVAELMTPPGHHQGVFTLQADGGFSYDAGATLGVGESDSFTYRVSDGINVSVEATVEINITGENSVPTSKSPVLTIDEDAELVLVADDLAEDEEASELLLKNAVAPFPTMGILEKLSGPERLRYTPNANEFGSDSFGYRVEDAGGAFVDVTVDVTVDAVNDVPTIVAEGGTDVTLAAAGAAESLLFAVADVEDDENGNGIAVSAASDDVGVVSVSVVAGATAGSWQVDFTGVADGTATVTVTATDTDAASNTVPMTIDVVVGSGNQVPTVESPSPVLTTSMGVDLSINIVSDAIADDADGDNSGLEIVSVASVSGGTVAFVVGAQQMTFTPAGVGTASFDLTVADEDGANATGTIVVEVTAVVVTQSPVLGSPILTAINGVAETWNITADSLATDPDTVVGNLVFSGTPTSVEGTVTVSGDNKSITFTPSAAGPATIAVVIEDPEGNTSAPGSLSVTVGAANVAPTVAATTLNVVDGIPTEFELVADITVTDSDGDAATVVVDSFANETNVTVTSVAGNDQRFSVTGAGAGAGSFDLVVLDVGGDTGQGVMTVTIAANQSPTASNLALTMGTAASLLTVSKADLGVGDLDSVAANVELANLNIVSVPASSGVGSADLGVAGADFSFTPDLVGDYVISFDVTDEVNVESFSVTITVN